MYYIQYYQLSQITELESAWRYLEKGQDMTYFQRYDWYCMLATLNKDIKNKNFEMVIATISDEKQTILIAPLWIVKKTFAKYNKRGIYFFGRSQWSDYLNFIYKEFDTTALDTLFNDLRQRYNINDYYLEELPMSSSSCQYLMEQYPQQEITENKCVALSIPESIAAYHAMLSKSSRQNIRTAINRAKKDGFEFSYNFDDLHVNIEEFSKYRNIRLVDKNNWEGKNLKWKIINFISTKILHHRHYQFPSYNPFTHDRFSRFITTRDQNGALCAAFNYGIDATHKRIVIMAVSTNPAYYRYSPGILALYHFVLDQIEKKDYYILDFTRGDERYKYELGGAEKKNNYLHLYII